MKRHHILLFGAIISWFFVHTIGCGKDKGEGLFLFFATCRSFILSLYQFYNTCAKKTHLLLSLSNDETIQNIIKTGIYIISFWQTVCGTNFAYTIIQPGAHIFRRS